jgi:uncharacterized protein (DUF2062 family)
MALAQKMLTESHAKSSSEHQPAPSSPCSRIIPWLIGLRGSPHAVALGVAVGVFVAFTPTNGVQTLLALALATVLGANRAAAMVPVWISNPLSIPPILALTYWVGSWLWNGPSAVIVLAELKEFMRALANTSAWRIDEQFRALSTLGSDIFLPMLFGGLLVGLASALVSYWCVAIILRSHQQKKGSRRSHVRAAARE